jgi:hypothetical protein
VLAVAAAVSSAALLGAQSPQAQPSIPSRTVRALRATGAIVLDGRLDEKDWQAADPARDFTQRDPNEGQPATESTEVRFLFDDDALYVGARMQDREPGRIARRLSRRDGSADGLADTIVVSLSPLHDGLTGSTFRVSAAGALWDAVLHNDTGEDDSWDAVWEAEVSTDESGWTAEMRIPFSQLRFETRDQQVWGLNVIRTIQRHNEEDWWVPVPKTDGRFVSRMGTLTGLDGLRGRRHLDLLPYATGRAEFSGVTDEGNPFNDGSRLFGGAGLDAKWGITSNLTIDGTINPDFGQVEVDPAVVNLSVFETFFDEKRPFFIEGAQNVRSFGRNGVNSSMGFNRTNPTLFYSRRIGRSPQGRASGDYVDRPPATTILGAAKLTGKTAAGWNIGVIDAITSREFADVALGSGRNRTEVEPLTNYLIARVRRDVGQRGGFGFITTAVTRNLREKALDDLLTSGAYLFGVDGHLFIDAKLEWVVTSGLSRSHVIGSEATIARLQRTSARYYHRPDADHLEYDPTRTSLSGWNFQLDFNRNAGNFRPNASLWAVTPGYEVNDIGFMSNVDRWGGHLAFGWSKRTPDRFSRFRQVIVSKFWVSNFDNEMMTDGLWTGGWVTFPNYWTGQATVFAGRTGRSDRLTRGGPMMDSPAGVNTSAAIFTDGRKPLMLGLQGAYSSSRGGGWDASSGVSLTWRPTSSLSFEAGPSLTRSRSTAQYVATQADAAAAATYGSRYVFGDLDQTEVSMTLRANWIVSPRMSFQLYAQPLLSTGRYFDFKEAAAPRTYSFLRYGYETGSIVYDTTARRYQVDPAAGNQDTPFAFGNPDFNFKSLRVNAVYRWEFRPGSTVYLVWTQMREDYARPGQFALGPGLSSLFAAPGDNVIMAKVSYWFSR